MNQQENIQALIESTGQAFSQLDFDGWLSHFHAGASFIMQGAVFSSSSYEEQKAKLMPVFEGMRAKGIKRTQLDLCLIKQLSSTTAIVSSAWSRIDDNDEVFERLGATYLVLETSGQWKIAMVTSHSADVAVVSSEEQAGT